MSRNDSPVVAAPESGRGRSNPLVAIAAISVIIFSAVGIGVMTGLIPSSSSKPKEEQPAAGAAPGAPTEAAKASASASAPSPRSAPEVAKTAPKRAETVASAPAGATKERSPAKVAAAEPQIPKASPCPNCGQVTAVNVTEQQGEASGLGAVAGGVAGAILGNQIGGGSGRKIATIAGAAGGAYAGHQIEKHVKTTKRYDVSVRMDDGSSRHFSFDAEPAFRVGDRVKVVDGTLVAE
jgi:outer membrane lipoprotein SlyB